MGLALNKKQPSKKRPNNLISVTNLSSNKNFLIKR